MSDMGVLLPTFWYKTSYSYILTELSANDYKWRSLFSCKMGSVRDYLRLWKPRIPPTSQQRTVLDMRTCRQTESPYKPSPKTPKVHSPSYTLLSRFWRRIRVLESRSLQDWFVINFAAVFARAKNSCLALPDNDCEVVKYHLAWVSVRQVPLSAPLIVVDHHFTVMLLSQRYGVSITCTPI